MIPPCGNSNQHFFYLKVTLVYPLGGRGRKNIEDYADKEIYSGRYILFYFAADFIELYQAVV